ncbi:unnamed protein product, partial [Ectocarpus sp. 12 AP-2014]
MVKDVQVPNCYKQAVNSKCSTEWCAAMNDEFQSLVERDVFSEVDLHGQKVVTCKWVFALKKDENGAITRFKARVVARGFNQVQGID